MGFDYIFDTNFSADLTIMEEGSEFLEAAEESRTMKRSRCSHPAVPGWVRFIKSQYPECVDQSVYGEIASADVRGCRKILLREASGRGSSRRSFCISIMPCIAKKHECAMPVMNDAGAGQDVDVVLTTREVDRLIRAEHIIPHDLKEEEFDTPLGAGTGAGVIFGATGGVMEAALRSAYYLVTGRDR